MSLCVRIDGAWLREDPAACATGYVVLTQAEMTQLKQTIKVDPATDPERVADMQALFYAFLAALVVVWGLKQLANLFTGDTSKD